MNLSRSLRRCVSAVLLSGLTVAGLAQASPSIEPSVNPTVLKRLRDSLKESSKITLVETGGRQVRGTVTDIQPEYVSITVTYGTASVHVPYSEIDHIDRPPLTHNGKVTLGVVIAASVAGIAILIAEMIKHA